MERAFLQAIATEKLADAELLFQHGRFSNSYYLFGYAAEIAIKARIAIRFRPETIPDKGFVNAIYSHNLTSLIGLAGLAEELQARRSVSSVFDSYWSVVSGWSEASRYAMVEPVDAASMREAMTDREGVFAWLQRYW